MRILRIYDSHMFFMGEIADYESLVWTRRWQEPGEFSVTAPDTEENVFLLKYGFFAWVRGEAECALIESLTITEDEESTSVEAAGRFSLALFSRRRIPGFPFTFRGTVEAAFRALIAACRPIFSAEDGITLLFAAQPAGETKVTIKATYRDLLAYLTRAAKQISAGIRLRPDFLSRTQTFEVLPGRDSQAVFSNRFDNLAAAEYARNTEEYANVCYVITGEGKEREAEEIGETASSGLTRREVALESRGEDEDEGQKCLEEEHAVSETFECEVDAEKPFRYGIEWDLGDTVLIRRPKWGIDERKRITEISIVTEGGVTRVIPVLGDPLPEKIKWEDSD